MTGQLWHDAIRPLGEAERFDWLQLVRCDNIGPRSFIALLRRYGSARAALEALPALVASGKSGRPIAIPPTSAIEAELAKLQGCGAVLVGLYGAGLSGAAAADPCTAAAPCRARGSGVSAPFEGRGGRLAQRLGCRARLHGADFARDRAGRPCHRLWAGAGHRRAGDQAALETGTIAVLAGGLGNIYPADHIGLLERLVEHGAAISEMPFGWEARGRDFPRRNRIVAGLSRGVVVIEAARRSGSLITAGFAADQGREIFAVPGSPLDPRAEGANDLLRDGATFCTKAEDVLEALARQKLAPDEGVGFAEPDLAAPATPFWDELDLPEFDGVPVQPPLSTALDEAPGVGEMDSADEIDLAAADLAAAGEAPAPLSREAIAARVIELLGPTPVGR